MSLDDAWEESGLVGKLIAGRYLIVRELASDNRRTQYEAEEGGARVTLSVVRAEGTARLETARKLRSLEHPGLVRVLDVGKLDSGELYVATERPDGTTLRALTGGKRLEPRRALLIIRQVLEALAAAHAFGALHGDIKPGHILILPGLGNDRVKVTELGVAALTGATRAGDPVYCAPESALGAIDGRADLYSTGAVLFELLTGHPPFFADDPNALRRLHAYAPMQTLKQRAPDLAFADLLEAVVAPALEKNREGRYQSASDMIAALDRALQPIEEAAAKPPERKRPSTDSLMLLAKDLMAPPTANTNEPIVPVNVTRHVRELPWHTRARRALAKLGRRRTIAASVVVLGVLIVGVAATHRNKVPAPAGMPATEKATAYLKRARAALAKGDEPEAMIAFEKALRLSPSLVREPGVADELKRLAVSKDADVRRRATALSR